MSAWIALLFSSSMDGSYARLSAASWAVVIGVAIEETPLFLKTALFIRGKFAFLVWNTGGISWLKKREKTFEAIGFILLVLGLVSEIRFQGAAESAEKDTRVASEIVVQGLRVRATNAEGRIAALQNSTAKAQADAARATADVARANGRAATLEIQAAQAEKDAADAKAAQAKLQAMVVWRRLDAGQCGLILNALPAERHGDIQLEYVDGDPESELYAIDIGNCLGAPTTGLRLALAANAWQGVVPFGVIVAGDADPLLSQLQQGFTQAGLAYSGDDKLLVERRSRCSGACGTLPLRITVGSRPVGN